MLHRPAASPVLHPHAAQLLHGGIGLASCSKQRHTAAQLTDHRTTCLLQLTIVMFAVDTALGIFCTVFGATISSEVSIAVTRVV